MFEQLETDRLRRFPLHGGQPGDVSDGGRLDQLRRATGRQWHCLQFESLCSDHRPLNVYVGYALEVFRCPRDKGDAMREVSTPLWEAYGNSYIMQTGEDSFHIKYVLALRNATYGPPVKVSEIVRTDNKIVVGDWPLHANRPIQDKRTQW